MNKIINFKLLTLVAILLTISLGAIALTAYYAIAQVAYRTNDSFLIKGLTPSKAYHVNLEGMPLIKTGFADRCGILKFKPSKADLTKTNKIEVQDQTTTKSYGFTYKSLPSGDLQCSGQVVSTRQVFIDKKKSIVISGLTPSAPVLIKFLSSRPVRNIKSNECGFIDLKLASVIPSAFIVNNQAFPTNSPTGRGMLCRRGVLYLAFPWSSAIAINPSDATTWLTQNPQTELDFSPGTIIGAVAGNTINWSDGVTGTVSSGGTTSSSSNNQSTTPPTSSSGSGGTSNNNQTPPNNSGSGTSVINGGGNPTSTPTPSPTPSQPQPPSGQKMCKVGTQLVVVVPKKDYKYYAATSEDQSYEEQNSDSNGFVIFNNINFSDTDVNGNPSPVEIGEIIPNAPSYQNRNPLGGLYTVTLDVVQPCR